MDIADPQQWHGYAYSRHNPATFSDPSGLIPADCVTIKGGCPLYQPGNEKGNQATKNNPKNRCWPVKCDKEADAENAFDPDTWTDHMPDGRSAPSKGYVALPVFAQLVYGTHISNLNAVQLERLRSDVLCYNYPDICKQILAEMWGDVGNFLGEITGVNDAIDCSNGSVSGCAWTIVGFVPIGKLKAAGKIGEALLDTGKALCSFSPETKVVMADGTFKPISDLRVGDRVLATDPEAGVTNGKIVTHIWIHEDHLRDLKINGKALFTTAGHPFWNARVKRWDPANQLKSHDRLLSLQGVSIRLDGGLAQFARFGAAYNLTVADIHTYYVVAGNTPVLVHNTGCGPTARFAVDSSGVAADLKPLGRGSTGRTAPNNLTEQMAMHEAMSSPANGTLLPLRKGMTDARWPGSDGWVKMSQNVNGVEIHYVMNAITGQVDDFKFKG